MIISHKYKLISIKNRKVAGTNFEEMMLNYLGEDDVCSLSVPENSIIVKGFVMYDHMGWQDIARIFPDEWNNYYKIVVERNPWDKVVSRYYWVKLDRPEKVPNGFEGFVFSDEIEKCCDWNLYASGDQVMVDEVILFEDLHNTLTDHPIIPYNGELQTIVEKNGAKPDPNEDYHEYYTPETQQRVADVFSNEINYFGYQF